MGILKIDKSCGLKTVPEGPRFLAPPGKFLDLPLHFWDWLHYISLQEWTSFIRRRTFSVFLAKASCTWARGHREIRDRALIGLAGAKAPLLIFFNNRFKSLHRYGNSNSFGCNRWKIQEKTQRPIHASVFVIVTCYVLCVTCYVLRVSSGEATGHACHARHD